MRSAAEYSATFRRALVLQLLNRYHTISAVTALQAAAQIEVACSILCVLRDEHLSIDRPVCQFFGWPASITSYHKDESFGRASSPSTELNL